MVVWFGAWLVGGKITGKKILHVLCSMVNIFVRNEFVCALAHLYLLQGYLITFSNSCCWLFLYCLTYYKKIQLL